MPSPTNKRSYVYIDETEVLVIHAKIIDATGGSHGVRNVELVRGALDRPKTAAFGKELFSGVFEKAASYFDSISKNHPFVDGNKRTSFALAARFLEQNGYMFEGSNDEVEDYVVKAVVEHHDVATIALWLKANSRKLGRR